MVVTIKIGKNNVKMMHSSDFRAMHPPSGYKKKRCLKEEREKQRKRTSEPPLEVACLNEIDVSNATAQIQKESQRLACKARPSRLLSTSSAPAKITQP